MASPNANDTVIVLRGGATETIAENSRVTAFPGNGTILKIAAAGGFFGIQCGGDDRLRPGRLVLREMFSINEGNWRVFAEVGDLPWDKDREIWKMRIDATAADHFKDVVPEWMPQGRSGFHWDVGDCSGSRGMGPACDDGYLRLRPYDSGNLEDIGRLFRALALPPQRRKTAAPQYRRQPAKDIDYLYFQFRDKFVSVF